MHNIVQYNSKSHETYKSYCLPLSFSGCLTTYYASLLDKVNTTIAVEMIGK